MTEEPHKLRRYFTKQQWKILENNIRSAFRKLDLAKQNQAKHIATFISRLIGELDGLMDTLCNHTCHICTDICCKANLVFYNETDLFFLVSLNTPFPPFQTRMSKFQDNCSYWIKSAGCLLPRLFRPYVCTWFICEKQVLLMEKLLNAKEKRHIEQVFQTIRQARLALSTIFAEVIQFQNGIF